MLWFVALVCFVVFTWLYSETRKWENNKRTHLSIESMMTATTNNDAKAFEYCDANLAWYKDNNEKRRARAAAMEEKRLVLQVGRILIYTYRIGT
jgi:hypothetical protein